MNNKHSQVLLVFRKSPRKWNYGWSSVLKTCAALMVGIFEQFCCFDKIFLMALTFKEQLFIERPLYTLYRHVSCIMITYPISSNVCKKSSLQCYRLYNCPFFRSSHWRSSVRKRCSWKFHKIHRKILLIFLLSSLEDFLIIHSNRKVRWKMGNTLMELKYLPFCWGINLCYVKDFKRNLTDTNLIRKCV